ncbi:MAG: (5-formylfuran-3-yl)methyl phosphate synthase [Methylococcales bacterium]|nr:(5-formylfuran-3-yl)methyl phosphate synthase [Methylococcales bacterium]
MSLMLASVNSLTEARLARDCGVDIIDLKQPAAGALGALDVSEVAAIVAGLPADARISATVGDLPMQRAIVVQATADMAATGVDYVKIGFFPGGEPLDCLAGLTGIAAQGHALIAVLFADTRPNPALIDAIAAAGFRGVMLDTLDKSLGSLTQLLSLNELATFVTSAKSHSLLTGLAGSLAAKDIPALLTLEADYLGFRGALCTGSRRTAAVDEERIRAICSSLRAVC